jgi:hypothetical protein
VTWLAAIFAVWSIGGVIHALMGSLSKLPADGQRVRLTRLSHEELADYCGVL